MSRTSRWTIFTMAAALLLQPVAGHAEEDDRDGASRPPARTQGDLPPPRIRNPEDPADAPRRAPPRRSPPRRSAPRTAPTPPAGLPEAFDHGQPPPPPPPSSSGASAASDAPASKIVALRKTHDQAFEDGTLALELATDFRVEGEDGSRVYVAAWFVDRESGRLVRSTRRAWADSAGNLTLQTRPVTVKGETAAYRTHLLVPYSGFPRMRRPSYEVGCRVYLLRREPENRVRTLAHAYTTFVVHGEPAPEPAAEGRDDTIVDVPDEQGPGFPAPDDPGSPDAASPERDTPAPDAAAE